MATQAPSQVTRTEDVFQTIERVAKMSALAIPVIYLCGFIVVALYEAQYGITAFSLLKVRAIAAGLLFSLLFLVPAIAGMRSFRLLGLRSIGGTRIDLHEDSQKKYFRVLQVSELYPAAVFVSMCFSFLFEPRLHIWLNGPPDFFNVSSYPLWIVFFVGIVTCGVYALFIAQHFPIAKHMAEMPRRCATLSVLTVALWIIMTYVMSDSLFFKLTLWTYVVSLLGVFVGSMIERGQFGEINWEIQALAVLSISIGWFATAIYGNVNAAYGGGHPVHATFYLQEVSPALGSKVVSAFIIDETENGFYISQKTGNKKAIFIPRSSVASVKLGDGQ